MKRFCSIISCFLAITILISSSAVTAHAATAPALSSFWGMIGQIARDEEMTPDQGYVGWGDYLKSSFSSKDSGCTSSQSKNGCHYWKLASDLPTSTVAGKFRVKCQYCGMYYADYSSCDPEKEAETAYSNNISTLPATGYDSAGKLLWQPKWSDAVDNQLGFSVYYFRVDASTHFIKSGVGDVFCDKSPTDGYAASFSGSDLFITRSLSKSSSLIWDCRPDMVFAVPIAGSYKMLKSPAIVASCETASNSNFYTQTNYDWVAQSSQTLGAGGYYYNTYRYKFWNAAQTDRVQQIAISSCRANIRVTTPVFEVTPLASNTTTINNTYNINTRVNNFQGNYYNNVTNNYYNNTTIINETTNNYYDMTTNNYYTMSNWSYDYQSRTYFVTLEDGTTITVQFGDDCLTITNNNVEHSYQYVINNNNTPSPNPETPSTCKHNWTETIDVAPTCLEGGHANFTCSLCGETYEQILSAKGHNWTVKEHVNTVYGENGVIVTQGHTLYECSACGEQWYTETATPPPDVSGGSSIRSWLQAFQLWLDGKLDSLFSAADAVIVTKLDALIEKTSDTVVNVIGDNTYVPGVLYLDDDNGVVNTTKNGVSIFGDLLRWLWQNVFDGAFEAADITKLDGLFYDPTEVTTDGS